METRASEAGSRPAEASALLDNITLSVENQNPVLLHALAFLLEKKQSSSCRLKEENIYSVNYDDMIWQLIRVIWDEFYKLISSTFLSKSTYSESVRAAAARLLFICSQSFKHTHCFDHCVLENIKRCAINHAFGLSVSNQHRSPDIQMLRTYSIGLITEFLPDGGQLMEDVLTSQLPGNLMRYLQLRVLADEEFDEATSYGTSAIRLGNDQDASFYVASMEALSVIETANAVQLLRNSVGSQCPNALKSAKSETSEDFSEFFILDSDSLAKLRDKLCIQCLVILGRNVGVLETLVHEKGVDVCITLLQPSSNSKDASKVSLILPDVLRLINALVVYPKFATVFVDSGGIPKLLAAPRVSETLLGLSCCLFSIGSIPGLMERVCALPSNIVQQVVELALELLACPQDQARKNAALFFGSVFVFREILDAFDSCDGLQKMLGLFRDAASVSSENQINYHTCVALRQYFRAHLILLVDSVGPNKDSHTAAPNITNSRAAYKPLDISNEGVNAIFCLIRKERKLGTSIVKACFSAVDKFLSYKGHVTMLELCRAPPPAERHLYGLQQYALDVLRIVTLVPYSRILIINATVSNDRSGMAIILNAARGAGYVEPEIIQAALNVLVNLVCPLPSVSNEPPVVAQGQPVSKRNVDPSSVDRSSSAATSSAPGIASQTSASVSVVGSGLVGDQQISLGAGLAALLELGYLQAREAVRANNGVTALLQILRSHIVTLPDSLDCLRTACRVLLGLAREDNVAPILTKLQVQKNFLSELLIKYSSSRSPGTEQNRWQTELVQVAVELLVALTNSLPTYALAATDAASPITYRSRELLQHIHEHLQASGMTEAAAVLLKEAQLTPFPSMAAPSSLPHQANLPFPSGRVPLGFMSDKNKI